jgi:hypothetical protein
MEIVRIPAERRQTHSPWDVIRKAANSGRKQRITDDDTATSAVHWVMQPVQTGSLVASVASGQRTAHFNQSGIPTFSVLAELTLMSRIGTILQAHL